MKTAGIFDVRLASDMMSHALEQRLMTIGFKKDAFIGGTTGVVHPCHYSNRPMSREMLEETWNAAIQILSTASESEFYGYAEAEITPFKFHNLLCWKPFDKTVHFPFEQMPYEECPPDRYKDFDIHITANLSSIDPVLKRFLEEEIGFHYVDIRKPSGIVVRVYTVQSLGVKKSPDLYRALVSYFREAGGIEGKIKLEATYAYARFPRNSLIPPIISKMPKVRNTPVKIGS